MNSIKGPSYLSSHDKPLTLLAQSTVVGQMGWGIVGPAILAITTRMWDIFLWNGHIYSVAIVHTIQLYCVKHRCLIVLPQMQQNIAVEIPHFSLGIQSIGRNHAAFLWLYLPSHQCFETTTFIYFTALKPSVQISALVLHRSQNNLCLIHGLPCLVIWFSSPAHHSAHTIVLSIHWLALILYLDAWQQLKIKPLSHSVTVHTLSKPSCLCRNSSRLHFHWQNANSAYVAYKQFQTRIYND